MRDFLEPVLGVLIIVATVIGGAWAFGDYRFYPELNQTYGALPLHNRLPSDFRLSGREIECQAWADRHRQDYHMPARCVPVSLPYHWWNLLRRWNDADRRTL